MKFVYRIADTVLVCYVSSIQSVIDVLFQYE